MILQSMTNASGVSDGTMDINFVEPNRSKSPSPASTSGDASEASLVETGTPSGPTPEPPLKTKTKTPFKALRPCRKIDVPENLAPVPVGPRAKGEGLPYAPEGFPNPEDKWMWKVGKRKNSSGYWIDRYLILPKNLQEGAKQTYFWTKKAAEKYMMERFPEVDLESFFASFIWSVPSTGLREANGGEDMISSSAKRVRKSDIIVHERACNAGNAKCCLETGKGKIYKHMDCDICCVESGFCRECSCILCGKCVDHDLDEYYFIQCQEKLSEEFICGHVAHLECAIICQTGGVVRSIGLDVEYYCRRCDKKTDLLKHVLGLITTPGSGKLRSDVENNLNLALGLIQGTQQMRCRSLENLIQKGVKKLQSGMELQDIFGDVQDNSGTVNAGMAQEYDAELDVMHKRVSDDRRRNLMHRLVERGSLVSHAWPKMGVGGVVHEGFREVKTKLETTHKEDRGTQTEGPSGAHDPSIPLAQVKMVLENLFHYTLPLDGLELPYFKLPCAYPFKSTFAPALRALEMHIEQEQQITAMDGELRAHERTIHAQESQIQDLQDCIKDMQFHLNFMECAVLGPWSHNRLRSRTRPRIDNEPANSGVSHRA